jgi:hypothetical protein
MNKNASIPVLERVAIAVSRTKTLSTILEATQMMTQAWASTTIQSIGNIATLESSVQRKEAALSQLTELFQIRPTIELEMKKNNCTHEKMQSSEMLPHR